MDFLNLPIGTTFYSVANPSTCKIVIEGIYRTYTDEPDYISTCYKTTVTYTSDPREDERSWSNDLQNLYERGYLFLTEKEAFEFRLNEAEEELITKTKRLKETIEFYKKKVAEAT
jgi:hypothetical protein